MNIKKTSVMFNNYILYRDIRVDDEIKECVQESIYLRQKINTNPDYETETKRRIEMG